MQQKKAGVEVVQIFDSWAGLLKEDDLEEYCFTPNKNLVNALNLFNDFKPGTFNMPSADTTLTIRPTKAIVQTFVQAVDYQVHAVNLVRELGVTDFMAQGVNFTPSPWPIFKNKYSNKTTATSGTKLIQFFYTIDRRSNQPDQQKFSKWSNTNNSITFIGGSNTELSLATAGSYAPIQGGAADLIKIVMPKIYNYLLKNKILTSISNLQTSTPYFEKKKINSVIRVSFHYYNKLEEVKKLKKCLIDLIKK